MGVGRWFMRHLSCGSECGWVGKFVSHVFVEVSHPFCGIAGFGFAQRSREAMGVARGSRTALGRSSTLAQTRSAQRIKEGC